MPQKTVKLNENVNLNDFTVLLPSVCVGNAAQLAIDLIISTLAMRKVATVWHPAIIPVLGPRAFEHQTVADPSSPSNNITTACELFISESKQLACFQLRSPLVAGNKLYAFFDDVIAFLKEQRVRQFVILTGSFAHEQHHIGTSKFVYLPNEKFKNNIKLNSGTKNWIEWDQTKDLIHGGGFAMKFFKKINGTIPTCIFFKYISEGDNRSDAVDITQHLHALVEGLFTCDEIGQIQLNIPVSWKAMFGNEPTEQLY